ncbi:succinate dehydrogenase cytochrome b558 subunit [Paenibacillus cisolokensis]|jgi:succinate dehydrogenase / fumarate reductase cytochrome b subunit|uniref:Succinate dehydrogenase cytochrome b558 subunit n=1 Tax=Paenibacillus cisolokensis TaxID=1658519 RepID=A0ABQ4N9K3_9BACL|nr:MULTISPECIES: succinate dehydrogenase cytochrome b558 subunit [Paenibacillus]ALS26791.1 succinate dehydrogenase cytochrome B558 [Paenibacillus sp. 32O-W]GIQ64856.1 succinate dehydrogenase cytochrome b558 subunit [Paenibacillus cisolokensis]
MNGNSYYSRKLHSLLGVIPLSLFLVEHAITNYTAFEGGLEGFNRSVSFLQGLPLVLFLEIFGIFLPLIFHGVYGLYIAYQSDLNVGRFGYGRNWAFALQRITGVITFIFVFWHVYETRFQVAIGAISHEELGATMHQIFSNPAMIVLYTIGVLSAVFHFANGMWSFLVAWGITVGPRAQRISSYVWMGVFVIVSALFLLSIVAFRGDEFKEAADAAAALISIG